MENQHPSNVKVIFQRHLVMFPIVVASGFIAGTAHEHACNKMWLKYHKQMEFKNLLSKP